MSFEIKDFLYFLGIKKKLKTVISPKRLELLAWFQRWELDPSISYHQVEQLQPQPFNGWTAALMDQWQAWDLIMSPVLAKERPKKTVSDGTERQTDRQTDGHCALETDSVKITYFG